MPYIGSGVSQFNTADSLTVSGTSTLSGNVSIPDSTQLIFGDGSDFKISHNGSKTKLEDTGTGNLEIRGTNIEFYSGDGGETLAKLTDDGAAELYHNNTKRIETSATGVDITGGFTATDGCTITTTGSEELNLELISTNADANKGPVISFHRNSSSPANSDTLAELNFNGENDASEKIDYVDMFATSHNVADGSEEGGLTIRSMVGGTLRNRMTMYGSTTKFNDDSQDIDFIVESNGNANMLFIDGGNDRVLIGGNGAVISSSSKLGVHGRIDASVSGTTPLSLNRSGSDGVIIDFGNDGSFGIGNVSVSGSSVAFNTSSDYRLKQGVEDMTGAIDRVKALAPKRFQFIKDANTTVDGFLAHEAQAVVPEAVTGSKDEVDDDGNAVMQGIDQSKLVPLLCAALKESIAKIETLETKVAALEAGS